MKRMLTPMSIAAAALAVAMSPAFAAGPYDGMWIVDAPAAGQAQPTERSSGCEAVRIPFQIVDNKVSGSLQRAPYGTGRVQAGKGSPITGTVQPDGSVNAQWQSYKVTGKLSGDTAEVRWTGECGPRVATGGRVAESTGSSRPR